MSATRPSTNQPTVSHDLGAQDQSQSGEQGQQWQGRTLAEWVSLAISALIVLGLVGTLTYLHFVASAEEMPNLQVTIKLDQVRQVGEFFYVPVEIANQGTEAGEEVRVRFSLTDRQGRSETTDVLIDFLAGQEAHNATVAFASDPSHGRLSVSSISYRQP